MRSILLLIIIFSNIITALDVEVIELKNKSPERVLYIGNSYLYYNDSLHNHVRRMLEEEYSKEIDRTNYKMVTISGSRLPHHNIDYPLNHINLGAIEPFELVILQGGSGEANTISERKDFSLKAKEMIEKIHEAGAEAALYMIHAYVEPHENTNPEMIENIKKMYIDVANQNNVLVIPVGQAFENAYDINPDIVLHKEYDGSHPSLLGTYLAACVVFSSITHKSPLQIQYDYFGKIDEVYKKFLQEVAKETVEDFYGIKL